MKNERVKKGDIRINEETKEVEICAGYLDCWDGRSPRWEAYETYFLHTRMGMDTGSDRVHTLQYVIDVLDKDKSAEKERPIFDSDIRGWNLNFMINSLKQLMGTDTSSTGKETTKIYMKYVREAINLLDDAIRVLERIKENDSE